MKRVIQMLADATLILFSFILAMALRLESLAFLMDQSIWMTLIPVVLLTLFVFDYVGLYRVVIRYISGQVIGGIITGVFVSALAILLAANLLSAPVPLSVPGIYAAVLFILASGMRFMFRRLFRTTVSRSRVPVMVYGAGEVGRQVANALQDSSDYLPVAFLDDDPTLQKTTISGREVFAPSEVQKLVAQSGIQTILLAMPGITRARRREIVSRLEPLGVKVKTTPGMSDIVTGRAKFSDLRSVTPEDLLGRDPVPPRDDLMSRNITGKVVLVSGAGGSIGSELCRQIINHDPATLVLLEVSEYALYSIHMELKETLAKAGKHIPIEPVLGSVQNPGRVRAILRMFGVETVYHAAAYKHVVLVEENVVEGIRNNVFGTQVIATAAAELGVENFILISTDKAVRPTNFMGGSKRLAELVCQALARKYTRTTFSMVRFGNVLGSSGSVIPRFRAQIESGGPVTVTHREITRFFMTIPEAAQLVIQAGAMAKGGDVFVLDMGEPVKILDLAQTMVHLHGLKPYIVEDTSAQEADRGDIPIQIVGLNKGEKLYEELLIGENPQGTDHQRIMTATEVSLDPEELQVYLDRLTRACRMFDIVSIRDVFLEAPLDFRPTSDAIHDLMWNASRLSAAADEHPDLKVVSGTD
ncbi:MAG: polysaccharide biosynthesis protein [Paracoccaceae bacterium]